MDYSNSILLDSSVLISWFLPHDSRHTNAKELVQKIAPLNKILTNHIWLEIATVLSQRSGKKQFIESWNTLQRLPMYEFYIPEVLDQESREIFFKIVQKDISYVDVSSVIVMKKLGIRTVATFDKHFGKLKKLHPFKVIC